VNNSMSVIDDNEATGVLSQMHAPTANIAVQLAAALVDKRIATARTYRRSISKFKQEASQLLKEDVETARSAEYAKPVGNGVVRGPSVRLAELAAMCWTNLDVEVHEPIVGDKSVSVKAVAWDLERNYRQEAVVTTSILNRQGQRYPAHMVETASLATAAKAKRNAIISVIPRAYIQDLLAVAKQVAGGSEKPLDQRRVDMLDYFARTHKVQAEQVFKVLQIDGLDDITEDLLDTLRGIATAIKEGSQVDEFFTAPAESKADAVKAKLAERKVQLTHKPDVPASDPPAILEAPPNPKTDVLDGLIAQAVQVGVLGEWLTSVGMLIEDVDSTKAKKRSELCDSLSKFLKAKTA
jgi:hypothetical protein